MKTKDISYKAFKALQFLNNHPAFINISSDFFSNQSFCISAFCKNREDEGSKNCVVINKGDPGWQKFKSKFKDEETYIYATYKEKYGYPWKFDHVEYFIETDFFVFRGDPNKKNDEYNFKKYHRYHGFCTWGKSFEDAVLKCKRKVVSVFGNFCTFKMLTDEEKENHKKEEVFFFSQTDANGYCNLITNKNYIHVPDCLINLRWLKWFSKTPYCIKNWGNEFDDLVKNVKWDA